VAETFNSFGQAILPNLIAEIASVPETRVTKEAALR
jgi:hypothetical protein